MENTRTISKKKSDALYSLIHEEIIKVRVSMATAITDNVTNRLVDDALSKLCYVTPQKAIDLFLKTEHGK